MDGRRFGACFVQGSGAAFFLTYFGSDKFINDRDLLQGFAIQDRVIYVMEKNNKDMRRVPR